MKKLACLFLALPAFAMADQVATTAAISTLKTQLQQLQQQVQTMRQNISTTTQGMSKINSQINVLKKQIVQYGNNALSQFKWVDATETGAVPSRAFVAARNDSKPVYICQALYSNGSGYYGGNNSILDPGVVTPKGCVITYSGQSYLVPLYSVLTSNVSGYWVSGDLIQTSKTPRSVYPLMLRANGSASEKGSAGPSNEPAPLYNALAIIGGQENGANAYICRVKINKQYFVGKAMNNTCYIATGRYEASWPVFEVLLTRKP